jgi:hypothetical protein
MRARLRAPNQARRLDLSVQRYVELNLKDHRRQNHEALPQDELVLLPPVKGQGGRMRGVPTPRFLQRASQGDHPGMKRTADGQYPLSTATG